MSAEATASARYGVKPLERVVDYVRRHSLLFAVLLPFAVCAPLLAHKGLFEFGDADFPLRPFPLDFVLPWQSFGDGGVDNVLIGLPRVAYYAGINLVELISFTLQFAQWLWYSGLLALGVAGGTLLARRLGAGPYATALGLFWAMNVWSYDRVSQGPVFLAYQALPLAFLLFLRYLDSGKPVFLLGFCASTLLLTPSLQIAYITAAFCALAGVYVLAVRAQRAVLVARLVACAVCVGLFNAYFLAPLLVDIRLNSHNSLHLVSSNFSNQTFIDYSLRATLGNALQLAAFFYSTLDQQPYLVHAGAWMPFLALLGAVAVRAVWRESRFWAALALFVFGIWLVAGITLAQPALLATRALVPGLKSFVEPDYFTPVLIFGYLAVISFGAVRAGRTYGTIWPAIVVIMVAAGVAAYVPGLRPLGGLPQSPIPKTYGTFARSSVEPRVLWMPPIWVARYKWSPYTLNGFNVVNSPVAYMGPYMLEWVSPDVRTTIDTLVSETQAGHTPAFAGLATALRVHTIAVSADELDMLSGDVSPTVHQTARMMWRLTRSGFAAAPVFRRDGESTLITQRINRTFPLIGLYQSATAFDGDYQFLGDAVNALVAANAYRPVTFADGTPRTTSLTLGPVTTAALVPPLRIVEPHTVPSRPAAIPDATINLLPRFATIRDCTDGSRIVSHIHAAREVVLTDKRGHTRCVSTLLPVNAQIDRDFKLSFSLNNPAMASVQLVFLAKRHDARFVDASQPVTVAVPPWAHNLQVIVYGTPHRTVRYRALKLQRWGYHGIVLSRAKNDSCAGASFLRTNAGMAFHVSATLSGACSLVFRESFSTLWAARIVQGDAAITEHERIDGYANAWELRGHGPIVAEIYNKLLMPFKVGAIISILSILLVSGMAILPSLRRRQAR